MRLREITGSETYGQTLVGEYYKRLCLQCEYGPTAVFKILRGELRTIFNFIRNDYAHALREISDGPCRVLLDRISSVLSMIERAELESREGA